MSGRGDGRVLPSVSPAVQALGSSALHVWVQVSLEPAQIGVQMGRMWPVQGTRPDARKAPSKDVTPEGRGKPSPRARRLSGRGQRAGSGFEQRDPS